MAPTDSSATNTWAVQHVLALVEIWALVAQHSGFVGAWRLTAVCRASLAGVKEWLGTLPGLVVSGGYDGDMPVSEVWRLNLATLQWIPMPALVAARCGHACCVVRGALVVLGGYVFESTSRVEMLSAGGEDGYSPSSRLFHAARSQRPLQSRWRRATALQGKCSCSEAGMSSASVCRQCT
jgi:hypothetical protein